MANYFKIFSYLTVTTVALSLSNSAQALHFDLPENVSLNIITEIQNEKTFDSDNNSDEKNNLFLRQELYPTIQINDNFTLEAVAVIEPFDQAANKNPNQDDGIFFESEGIFIEEIKLTFNKDRYSIWAGKFNPSFGTAWDFGRGIWTEDFAEDYEITEQLGLGAAYKFSGKNNSSYTLSAATFFNDTTMFSKSTLTSREKTKLSDGGAGNTEDFSSAVLSLDGENLLGFGNLNYHLGLRHLGQGDADVGAGFDDETGVSAMVRYNFNASDLINLDTLIEYTNLSNFGGVADKNHQYLTTSLVTTFDEQWNLTLSYTAREVDEIGNSNDFDDHLFQVSSGYDFQNGLTMEAGYKQTEEANIESNIFGFLARYTQDF